MSLTLTSKAELAHYDNELRRTDPSKLVIHPYVTTSCQSLGCCWAGFRFPLSRANSNSNGWIGNDSRTSGNGTFWTLITLQNSNYIKSQQIILAIIPQRPMPTISWSILQFWLNEIDRSTLQANAYQCTPSIPKYSTPLTF